MKYGRTFNFSAGPAMMPEPVLEEIRDEMMNYRGSGMCVMEMSHRSPVFQQIIDEAEQDLRDLMGIPDNYKVLFIQGGATLQFSMIPMNLIGKTGTLVLTAPLTQLLQKLILEKLLKDHIGSRQRGKRSENNGDDLQRGVLLLFPLPERAHGISSFSLSWRSACAMPAHRHTHLLSEPHAAKFL